ncbi:MAG: DM13 domain-containing protein, partial [Acidimicrobiales bacterium]|nr:DM13 domain-containing protein [Acidimicrobiales bacterium]
ATDNGPDLNVYLSTAPADADEGAFDDDFVDLGDLQGNIGDQNYEVPADVDLDRYQTVVIWCVRFGVAFGAATLA